MATQPAITKPHFEWLKLDELQCICRNRKISDKGRKEELCERIIEFEESKNEDFGSTDEYNYVNFTVKSLKCELKMIGLSTIGKKQELIDRLDNVNGDEYNCYEEFELGQLCDKTQISLQNLENSLNKFNSFVKHYVKTEKAKEKEKEKSQSKKKQSRKKKQIISMPNDHINIRECKQFGKTLNDIKSDIHALRLEISEFAGIDLTYRPIISLANNKKKNKNKKNKDGNESLFIVYDDKQEYWLNQDQEMIIGAFDDENVAESIMGFDKNFAMCEMSLQQ